MTKIGLTDTKHYQLKSKEKKTKKYPNVKFNTIFLLFLVILAISFKNIVPIIILLF